MAVRTDGGALYTPNYTLSLYMRAIERLTSFRSVVDYQRWCNSQVVTIPRGPPRHQRYKETRRAFALRAYRRPLSSLDANKEQRQNSLVGSPLI